MTEEKKTQKKKRTATATMEVPRTLNIAIRDGCIVCNDKRNTIEHMLFNHCQASMNGRNDVDYLKGLAAAHGYEINLD